MQAISAWTVKPRHAPSRHCRDARVYGHTTEAMHDIETPLSLFPDNRQHETQQVSPLVPQEMLHTFDRANPLFVI